ncbi:hypothetical protein ACFW96_11750, partial [Streptomyces gardneri]|uniref:hypothetical protein n=1 Tax=Streptomyces gardneri TaxID=66892 RepID=UPI0036B025EA
MPLPFLTADRAFDTTDHVALPFDDHDQWRRPYRPGSWRVGAAALALLLASFVLLAAVIIVAAGGFAAAGVTLGIAVLVILAALRMLRVGTWVSRAGVRRVGFFVTSTVPWAKVTSVRTVQQPVRWLGLPRTVQGQALVLGRQGGGGRGGVPPHHNPWDAPGGGGGPARRARAGGGARRRRR